MSMTPKMRECLQAIDKHIVGGVAPSVECVAVEIGASSKSTVARLYDELEERGYVTRLPRQARSIEITAHGRRALSPHHDRSLRDLTDIDLYDLKSRVRAECDRRLDRLAAQLDAESPGVFGGGA